MKTIRFTARTSMGATFVVTLVLVSACSKTPDPATATPTIVAPASTTPSTADSASAPALAASDVQAPGTVGTLTLPSDAGASAPMAIASAASVGIPPADPSASAPTPGRIGPSSSSDAQPASVSPGSKQ